MNKYHNRNRIFSPIMTIHDILTLHILSSFLPIFLPSLFLLSLSLSFFLPFLFFFSLYSLFPFSFLSLFLPFLSPSLPLSSLLSSLLLSSSFFSLSSIVKGEDYLTIQTSSVIVPGCPNDGEQTYMALFSHAYLLSAGASKRGAALK